MGSQNDIPGTYWTALLQKTQHTSQGLQPFRTQAVNVKVETARWVREQVENRSGVFYNHAHAVTLRAASPDLSVGQLSEPGANLHYAAAYTAMIAKAWAPFFDDISHQHARVGIIATLYSLGLSRTDGTLRLPHAGARMNHFGEVAQTFFDSFELRQEFSQ